MNIVSVFQDCEDRINVETNGQFSLKMFNRFSRIAELRLLEWLTGDINAMMPPEPYLSQKNKDWLSPLIKKYPANVVDGELVRPKDYYRYESLSSLSGNFDCEDDEQLVVVKTPVKILSSRDKFYGLVRTNIESLKPTIEKPIALLSGNSFEFFPTDIGSVKLEYVRYPIYGMIGIRFDEDYQQEVPDEDSTIDYEWGEWAREILIYFIVDSFSNRTREQALKQVNVMTNKTIRDSKQ